VLVSGRAFKLASNDQEADPVVFDFTRDQVRYTLTDSRGSDDMVAGLAQLHERNTTMTGARLHHEYELDTMRVVAGAVWRSPDALELTWQYVGVSILPTRSYAASLVIESQWNAT
jgi:hypothetical protein